MLKKSSTQFSRVLHVLHVLRVLRVFHVLRSYHLTILILCFSFFKASANDSLIYHPGANAVTDIAEAVVKAKAEKKHILIMAGGNWCTWCYRFNRIATADRQIDSLIQANYIVYHLNYSKENKNDAVFGQYGYPQRFGFPVFIILDADGKRIHTQNSSYLEQNNYYSKEKVMDFLKDWSPAALDPKNYP
jgi:thioredoxin-related protein